METQEITAKVKHAIGKVTGIKPEAISDTASYAEDLCLDSLSILEVTVSVENQFKFQASDEELAAIRTVADTVQLVQKKLCAQVA